jgi:NADH:ubiquinone reductase (H+-translocating)
VTGVDRYGVTVQSPQGEQHIESRTVLWAAGVAAADFTKVLSERTQAQLDRGGRVKVDEHCNVPGHPEIFVIGDASVLNGKDGKPLPGVAPTAMQQGSYVAKSIQRRLRGEAVPPFHYIDKGSLAVIGRARAVAQFAGQLRFSGIVAWLLWLFIHLMYLVGFQNRIIVFIRWAFNYLTYNRGARLITGEPERAEDTALEKPGHAQVPVA